MKKAICIGLAGCLLALSAALFAGTMNKTSQMSQLASTDVEALAFWEDIVNWWNRKDYVCYKVPCGLYDAEAAEAVEKGTGDEAHIWNCNLCTSFVDYNSK